MRAKVVVFPVRGRNWCFSTTVQPLPSDSATSVTPSSLKELFSKISFSNPKPFVSNAELLIDFVANKMNKGWMGLEKAPRGTFKNKIHGLGLRLLARVKPSEMFFKSIPKDVTAVEVTYPASLNPRLVRRRLQHIALRGTVIHRRYFYGSVSLLPLTTAFTVLPLPNIPFFRVLFRTYSHWRALQGSEQLLQLVSDGSQNSNSVEGDDIKSTFSEHDLKRLLSSAWVLQPSKELEELIQRGIDGDGLSKTAISDICNTFDLNPNDVLKYRNTM
ncbi:hypothetical protein L484_017981 [Morus notabilis]|uniref:Uncharacterized protein n=1 Tax=Morus notabilis TaxID=981085 RepID=W9RQG2_9ROSA|nr:uncharacterized protein C23H3.12c [Morus notabilis]EXB64648.1 hypothetical protein L484_017981 [Morus notabilis]